MAEGKATAADKSWAVLTEEGCGQSVAGRAGGAVGSGLLPGCEFRLQHLACGLGDVGVT